MSEVMTIQEAIEKVREAVCFPDMDPSREYQQKDNRYSLITRLSLSHALSSKYVHPYALPDAWGRMMNANRAHLVIMLREAGAGHDPFGDAEWSSTPTQVWENLAQVEQLPTLNGADLSRVDFKWADLTGVNLTGANLAGADLRWATLMGANLSHADLRGAIIDGTFLDEADLTGANVTGVNLNAAYLDDDTKLDGAVGLEL